MKVERPRARSSAAPTRENSRSTMPILRRDAPARRIRPGRAARSARSDGARSTCRPCSARSGSTRRPNALGRGRADRGRNRSRRRDSPPSSSGAPASTTGWRPPIDPEGPGEPSTTGRHPVLRASAISPRDAAADIEHRPAPRRQRPIAGAAASSHLPWRSPRTARQLHDRAPVRRRRRCFASRSGHVRRWRSAWRSPCV